MIPPKGSIPRRTLRNVKQLSPDRFGSIRFGVNTRYMNNGTDDNYYKPKEYKPSGKKKVKKGLKVEQNIEYLTRDIIQSDDTLEIVLEFKGVEYLDDKFTNKDGKYSINIKKDGEQSKLFITTNKDILTIDNLVFHDEILLPRCYESNHVTLKNNIINCMYRGDG